VRKRERKGGRKVEGKERRRLKNLPAIALSVKGTLLSPANESFGIGRWLKSGWWVNEGRKEVGEKEGRNQGRKETMLC
jgi:hypothetical protein